LNGIQEVSGSIPLISTKNTEKPLVFRCFFNFSELCESGFLQAL
jgi:hypothetical protein